MEEISFFRNSSMKRFGELQEATRNHRTRILLGFMGNLFPLNEVAVISCFNRVPTEISKCFSKVVVYDQSSDEDTQNQIALNFPDRILVENSGTSLANYFRFIESNFFQLPKRILFLKSNIIPRHINEKTFVRKIQLSGLVPIFNDINFIDKHRKAYHLLPGYFIERNNSWFMNSRSATYFHSCNDLLTYMFKDPILPEYLLFAPGGNYSTYGKSLESYPLNFWRFLRFLTSYQFFPPEAFFVERLLFIIFSAEYELNIENFDDFWLEKLEKRKNSLQESRQFEPRKESWIVRKLVSKIIFELDKLGKL